MKIINFYMFVMLLVAGVWNLEGMASRSARVGSSIGSRAVLGLNIGNGVPGYARTENNKNFNSTSTSTRPVELNSALFNEKNSSQAPVDPIAAQKVQASNQGQVSVSVRSINTKVPVIVGDKSVNVKATRVADVEDPATKNANQNSSGINFNGIVESLEEEPEEDLHDSSFENVDDFVPLNHDKAQLAENVKIVEELKLAEQAKLAELQEAQRQESLAQQLQLEQEARVAKEKEVLEASQEKIYQQVRLQKDQLNQVIKQRGEAASQSTPADNLGMTSFTTPQRPVLPGRQMQSSAAPQAETVKNDAISSSDLIEFEKPKAYRFKVSESRNNTASFQQNSTPISTGMPARRAVAKSQPQATNLDIAQSNDSSDIHFLDQQVTASNSNDFAPSSRSGKSNGSKQSQSFGTSAAMSKPSPILQENMSQAQSVSSSPMAVATLDESPIDQVNGSRAINNKNLVVAQPQRMRRSMQESTPVQTLDLASTQQGVPDMSKYDESLKQGDLSGLFKQKAVPNYDRAVETSDLQNLFAEKSTPSQPALSQSEMYQQSSRDYAQKSSDRFGSNQASNSSYDRRNAAQSKDPWLGQSNRSVPKVGVSEDINPVDNPIVQQAVVDAVGEITKTVVANSGNPVTKTSVSRFEAIKNSLVNVKNKFLSIFGFGDQAVSLEQNAAVDSAVSNTVQELAKTSQSNYSNVISDFLSQVWNILTLKSWRDGSSVQVTQSNELV